MRCLVMFITTICLLLLLLLRVVEQYRENGINVYETDNCFAVDVTERNEGAGDTKTWLFFYCGIVTKWQISLFFFRRVLFGQRCACR